MENENFSFLISHFSINGGGERVRTDDLLRARQALSQLSYTPGISAKCKIKSAKLLPHFAFCTLHFALLNGGPGWT